MSDIDTWIRSFFERARYDPRSAEAEYDALDPEWQRALEAERGVLEWTYARKVVELADREDFEELVRFLDDERGRLDDIVEWLENVPAYGERLDDVAIQNRRRFTQALDQWGDPVRSALLRRRELRRVYDQDHAEQTEFGSWRL